MLVLISLMASKTEFTDYEMKSLVGIKYSVSRCVVLQQCVTPAKFLLSRLSNIFALKQTTYSLDVFWEINVKYNNNMFTVNNNGLLADKCINIVL